MLMPSNTDQKNLKNYSLFTKICVMGSPAPKVKITYIMPEVK